MTALVGMATIVIGLMLFVAMLMLWQWMWETGIAQTLLVVGLVTFGCYALIQAAGEVGQFIIDYFGWNN